MYSNVIDMGEMKKGGDCKGENKTAVLVAVVQRYGEVSCWNFYEKSVSMRLYIRAGGEATKQILFLRRMECGKG